MQKNRLTEKIAPSMVAQLEIFPSELSSYFRSQRAEIAERKGFVPYMPSEYFPIMRGSSLDERLNYFCAFMKYYRSYVQDGFRLRRSVAIDGVIQSPEYFSSPFDDFEESYEYFCDIIYQNVSYNRALEYSSGMSLDVWIDDDIVFSSYSKDLSPISIMATYSFVK